MLLRRLRTDDGNILIIVVLVSLLIGALASLTLRTGEQADRASASDRNHDVALGVTEAAIHDAMREIEAKAMTGTTQILPATGPSTPRPCADNTIYTDSVCSIVGTTAEGAYAGTVRRETMVDAATGNVLSQGFAVDVEGTAGSPGTRDRTRHVKALLLPPELFPGAKYALYSQTSIVLQNNDEVLDGDVWADNGGVLVKQGTELNGSITSAQSYVDLENQSRVTKFVQTGGPNTVDGFSFRHNGELVGGDVKVSAPTTACPPEPDQSLYKAVGSGPISGRLTTWSTTTYAGTVGIGPPAYGTCTTAPSPLGMPPFNFNPYLYPADTWGGPSSPVDAYEPMTRAQFEALSGDQEGTYWVPAPEGVTPTQADKINLNGWRITGDITIVTDYPVDTNLIEEHPDLDQAMFTVVSHYQPAGGTFCRTEGPVETTGDCAIEAKNNFSLDGSVCKTAVLLYADRGPVAIKNNSSDPTRPPDMCGAVLSSGIEIKNNFKLTYDPRIDRMLAFSARTYEIARWEELPVD